MNQSWPPDYKRIIINRQERFLSLRDDPKLVNQIKRYYSQHPTDFIQDWLITYDPRNAAQHLPTTMPFIFFPRQTDFVSFLKDCLDNRESGLVEKSRDMGATWLCCAFTVWLWLFCPGSSVGWGSRKQELVDRLGDPDSIFEKIRMMIAITPPFFHPLGFNPSVHCSFMKIINPETGSTVTGEAGDNIGRGGRKLIYFKDEALDVKEKVLTPQGFRKIGDLVIGDLVIGLNGQPTKVVGVNDCGIYPTFRLSFSDGSTVVASEGHKWFLKRNGGEPKEYRTIDLVEQYKTESPCGQVHYNFRLPLISPVAGEKIALPLPPYVVGALLGDGSVTDNGFGITSVDPEIPARISELLPSGSFIEHKCGYWYGICRVDGRQGKGAKSTARLAAEAAGIWDMVCSDKYIPTIYKRATPNDRLELLRGLMDTDGSSYSGTNVFTNTSKRLCQDVMDVVRSLGGKASITKTKCGGYKVYVTLSECPFHLSRKKDRFNPKQSHVRSLVKITPTGRKAVRCITVAAEDGMFITNDYIPTHNSAHYERPERIEAALGDNTDVAIDISSVNGTANVFARKRFSGQVWTPNEPIKPGTIRVFIFDWRSHPYKTQEWYDRRREKAEREGLLHVFAQEVDRDYSAAVQGVLIPAQWVKAAVDVDLKFPELKWEDGKAVSGLDVADEGGDVNAQSIIKGVKLIFLDSWGEGDVGQTTNKALMNCKLEKVREFDYDSIGVGSGVKAETNRLARENQLPKYMKVVPWNASSAVMDRDKPVVEGDREAPLNEEVFANLKAQAYWRMRLRFEKTYKMVTQGVVYPVEELICLDSKLEKVNELITELSQPTYANNNVGKIIVNKKPEGSKSPNLADSLCIATNPYSAPIKRAGTW